MENFNETIIIEPKPSTKERVKNFVSKHKKVLIGTGVAVLGATAVVVASAFRTGSFEDDSVEIEMIDDDTLMITSADDSEENTDD